MTPLTVHPAPGLARALAVVPADPEVLLRRLPEALAGIGPALLPVSAETVDAEVAFVEHPGGLEGAQVAVDADVAVVIRTSGSTGSPKRVALPAEALLASARATNTLLASQMPPTSAGRQSPVHQPSPVTPQPHWLLALPVHYIAGLQVLVRALAAGTPPVVMPHLVEPRGHFTAEAFVTATDELAQRATTATDGLVRQAARAQAADSPHRVADATLADVAEQQPALFTALVPTQLHTLMTAAGTDDSVLTALRRYRAILVGGQRTDPAALQRARDAGVALVTTYGSSETSGGVVYGFADGQQRLAHTTLAVRDGAVLISGPTLAREYLGDVDRTAKAFTTFEGRRWFVTGDVGSLDEKGLTVTGRTDQIISTGGVKLDLNEVAQVVHEQPGLGDAVVVPFEDEKWGTRFAVYADGRPRITRITRDELNVTLRARLGRHAGAAALTYIDFGLPLLANGKVDVESLKQTADKLAGSALAAQQPSPKDAI